MHVLRLRKTLKPHGADQLIQTVRGRGLSIQPRLMSLYSPKELFAAGALALAAVVAGLAFGVLGWTLFTAAAAGLVHQHLDLRKFVRWAKKPLRRPKLANAGLQQASRSLRRSLKQARKRTHEALQQTSHFRGLTAALPDAAILVDADGNIENFNKASRALLHLKRKDAGNNLGTLLRHPDAIRLLEQQTPDTTAEFSFPVRRRPTLGTAPHSRGQGPGPDPGPGRDPSEPAAETCVRTSLANVSHELRTPLTIIVGYLEAIEDDDLDGATLRRLVGKLGSPTHRMQALVDDLLMLTRLESSPAPEPRDLAAVDVKQLVGSVVDDLAGLAGKRHQINQRAPCGLRVLGIEKELHSACSNLVANAIKYSPKGGEVNISWTRRRRRGHPGGERSGRGHPARTPLKADRALLSRRYGGRPGARRHRLGAGHRQACAQAAQQPTANRERGWPGQPLLLPLPVRPTASSKLNPAHAEPARASRQRTSAAPWASASGGGRHRGSGFRR